MALVPGAIAWSNVLNLATVAPAIAMNNDPDTTPQPTPPPRISGGVQGTGALIFFAAIFLAMAAGMGWLAGSGLKNGESYLPMKRASQRRTVSRAEEPAMFWISIGLYSAISATSFTFAAWLTKEGIKLCGEGRS